jgi:hypothetical protein
VEGCFRLVLSGDASNARRLRAELHSWLLDAGINGVVGSDIVGAVSEAFGNAVAHPLGRASDQVWSKARSPAGRSCSGCETTVRGTMQSTPTVPTLASG